MNSLTSPIQALQSPTLDSKKKIQTYYNKYALHGLRTSSFVAAIGVGAVLSSFAITLWRSDYNIPWTFLLAIVASYLTVICWMLTTLIMCCTPPHPILNLVFNVPLSALWIASTGIIVYNLLGTLSRSCSIANWGNNDGVSICNIYKLMFSGCVFATLSQLSLIILDVSARRNQNRGGRYTKMDDPNDLKMEPVEMHRPRYQRQAQLSDQSIDSIVHGRDTEAKNRQHRDQYTDWQPERQTISTAGHVLPDHDYAYSPSVYSQPSVRFKPQPRDTESYELAGSDPHRPWYQPYRVRDVNVGTVRMDHLGPPPGGSHTYHAYQRDQSYHNDRHSYLDKRY